MGECKDTFCVCKPGFKGDGYDSCEGKLYLVMEL